ncbi:MAG: hypothetical protein LLG00_07095 [Planctomycetaceae bacterium]|nr:hypothetical protein [Planctomycetaceae bacterium]
MLLRTGKILLLAIGIVAWTTASPTASMAWALWPFASESSDTTAKRPAPKTVKKAAPSTWDKMSSGTKSFCTKVGDTLTFKKTPPPKKRTPEYAVPRAPDIKPKKKESSWFGSWFKPADPKKPKTVSDWMDSTKRMDP